MVQNPCKVLSSSSEHLARSYPERGMGSRKTITGGELYVSGQAELITNYEEKNSLYCNSNFGINCYLLFSCTKILFYTKSIC